MTVRDLNQDFNHFVFITYLKSNLWVNFLQSADKQLSSKNSVYIKWFFRVTIFMGVGGLVEWLGKKGWFSKKFIKEKDENLPWERREILGILDHISLQSPLSSQSSWRMVDRP